MRRISLVLALALAGPAMRASRGAAVAGGAAGAGRRSGCRSRCGWATDRPASAGAVGEPGRARPGRGDHAAAGWRARPGHAVRGRAWVGTRPVAVPIEAMALLGPYVVAVDYSKSGSRGAADGDANGRGAGAERHHPRRGRQAVPLGSRSSRGSGRRETGRASMLRSRRASRSCVLGEHVFDRAELGQSSGVRCASSISSGLPGYQPSSTAFDFGVKRCVISSAVRSSAGTPASAAATSANRRVVGRAQSGSAQDRRDGEADRVAGLRPSARRAASRAGMRGAPPSCRSAAARVDARSGSGCGRCERGRAAASTASNLVVKRSCTGASQAPKCVMQAARLPVRCSSASGSV